MGVLVIAGVVLLVATGSEGGSKVGVVATLLRVATAHTRPRRAVCAGCSLAGGGVGLLLVARMVGKVVVVEVLGRRYRQRRGSGEEEMLLLAFVLQNECSPSLLRLYTCGWNFKCIKYLVAS